MGPAMRSAAVAAVGLLALATVCLVVQERGDVAKAELTWSDMGVPEGKLSDEDDFVEQLSDSLKQARDDEAYHINGYDCTLKDADGDPIAANGKACCDADFAKDTKDCKTEMQGCTAARLAKHRVDFNECASAAERDCDDEAEQFAVELRQRIDLNEDGDSKKKQIKNMAAAASNPSELMFAALTAVSTDKGDEASEKPDLSEETSTKNMLSVHDKCVEKRMGLATCESRAPRFAPWLFASQSMGRKPPS